MRLGAGILLVLLVATGCGVREGRVRVLSPEELPQDLYASPSPSPTAAPERRIPLYFVRDGRLVEAGRRAAAEPSPVEAALRALLAGPSPQEEDAGLHTAIPDGAELLEVSVSGGIASINLSREFELSAEQSVLLLRLGQVVYTATDVARVDRVRFLIDGEPANVIGSDGAAHEVVRRSDYATLESVPATPVAETAPP